MKRMRECQDCGDEIGAREHRVRCEHCGLLVCHWCHHHVHNGLHVQGAPPEAEARP